MGLISAIFSILTVIVGGVCIMLFVSTKTLRDSRDDQEKRIVFLEGERARDQATIADLRTAVAAAEAKALGLIAGGEKLDDLSNLLNEHHGEARQNWVVVTAGLGHLGTAIDHMNESIDRLVETLGGP